MVIIPPILRRVVDVPFVVHCHWVAQHQQRVFGVFDRLHVAESFRPDAEGGISTMGRTVARLDLPILPERTVDWADYRWLPRPGLILPALELADAVPGTWVAQVHANVGQRFYGPFVSADEAERFRDDYCRLRGKHAWGSVHELLAPTASGR